MSGPPARRQACDLIHATYDDVERMHRQGYISPATWRVYQTLWTWTATRFTSPACDLQCAYVDRHGVASLIARQKRLRRRLFDA